MEDTYLIEVRLARTRWTIKKNNSLIARTYNVLHFMERHPHITLYGPFSLNEGISPVQILDHIGEIAGNYDPLLFSIGSWEKREGMHGSVIAYSVTPSEALKKITHEIAGACIPLSTSMNAWDGQPDEKWFHITVANFLKKKKAEEIFTGLSRTADVPAREKPATGIHARVHDLLRQVRFWRKESPVSPVLLDDAGLRITIMNGDGILGEYDLLQKRWLPDKEIRDERSWQQSMDLYRRSAGFEYTDPVLSPQKNCFLIADLHLGHANIIHYCSRPFVFFDPDEMDHVLIKNWNYTVSAQDTVYYLGDLRYGRHELPDGHYKKKLKGHITFIRGNHDEHDLGASPSEIIDYEGYRFLLVHDPADAPPAFDSWVIHGHHHNNDLRRYPFICFSKKRINVSAEVVGYSPVSLGELVRIIKARESDGNLTPIFLRYPSVFSPSPAVVMTPADPHP
ncbi:MAG: 2'-5' RNA ligase family protein [Methanoregula sp.]|jgi:calcineurin-like phosphoesterase family protein